MIMPCKLDDLRAFGIGAGQTQSAHGRLSAAVDKTDHLDRGYQFDDQFGKLGFQSGWRAETRAAPGLLTDRLNYDIRRMAEYQRPPTQHIIDELVPIGIPYVRAFGMIDEQWIAAHASECPHRRIHAAGNHLPRGGVEFLRTLVRKLAHNRFSGWCLPLSPTLSPVKREREPNRGLLDSQVDLFWFTQRSNQAACGFSSLPNAIRNTYAIKGTA